MKYAVVTLGCRVNQADSFLIEDTLRQCGGIESIPETADLVVVNSCSVTASADQGTRQLVRRVARTNPQAKIVVTGCYASRRPDEVTDLPNVARVVANDHKDDVRTWLTNVIDDVGRFSDGHGPCGASLEPGVGGRTALTIRVQTGCDETCSYCIIPRTRGAGRSRPLSLIIDDVRRAVTAGYKEIVITGVHLGSYGRDLGQGHSLFALLDVLSSTPDDVLFRISSLEPMDCTPEIVALVSQSQRIAPHFHLPLQHGSDRVLRAMRRPYAVADFIAVTEQIRRLMPWAAIGSDVIAGFPGETERDAEETGRLLAALPLAYLHVFPYSDRPGTEASSLPGKVPGLVVRERARRWRTVGAARARLFRESQVGTVRRALSVDDGSVALTDNYIKIGLPAGVPRNAWVHAAIPPCD